MAKLFQMSLTVVFLPLLYTGLQAKGSMEEKSTRNIVPMQSMNTTSEAGYFPLSVTRECDPCTCCKGSNCFASSCCYESTCNQTQPPNHCIIRRISSCGCGSRCI
uniref:Bowman-Birk serine protease inhibitors family domain-containing protein n=1 Tax=Oryza nivara TaxID=4536 RepID=A0A0E0J7R5_ORYNI